MIYVEILLFKLVSRNYSSIVIYLKNIRLQLCNIFICVHSCDDLLMVILSSKFNPSVYTYINLSRVHYFHLSVLIMLFITDDDLKWFESLLTIFHLICLKKRKEQEYFETKSKIPSPKQVQELNNLQDLNSQSFDCHDQQYQSQLIIW
ncbi:hypothetical protein Avbf_15035 [Armadillidium vulgare]|nr:hypothetical protein Avbf_15035 [Armadillidium vulgare]